MGCKSIVILPEGMSQERFDMIEEYGAQVIKTPGCESNVKEIYDKTHELMAADPDVRNMNQFEVMGNYRFHYYVTGNTIIDLARTGRARDWRWQRRRMCRRWVRGHDCRRRPSRNGTITRSLAWPIQPHAGAQRLRRA